MKPSCNNRRDVSGGYRFSGLRRFPDLHDLRHVRHGGRDDFDDGDAHPAACRGGGDFAIGDTARLQRLARCFLWRKHIVWHVLPWYLSGIGLGFALVLATQFVPDKNLAFIMIGIVPLLTMAGGKYLRLHIEIRIIPFPSLRF